MRIRNLFDFLAYSTMYARVFTGNAGLCSSEIENPLLLHDVEKAAQKNEGVLTYSEYIDIVQYGEHGYQATSVRQGQTDVHRNWGKALVALCLQKGIKHVFEFGAGSGEFGLTFLQELRNRSKSITWTAIEREKTLQLLIQKQLDIYQFSGGSVVTSLKEIRPYDKSLVLFPYSLDSIAPEVFINTQRVSAYPNRMIGISVSQGKLHETIISPEVMKRKQLSLHQGIYTNARGKQFDLTSWKLSYGQRAYIPVTAYAVLRDYAQAFPLKTLFLVIDEFNKSPYPWEKAYCSLPKDLYNHNRECLPISRYYYRAGKDFLYFPSYLQTFLRILHEYGFRSIRYDIEQKMAHELLGKTWVSLKRNHFTYAFLAGERVTNMSPITRVIYPKHTLFLR